MCSTMLQYKVSTAIQYCKTVGITISQTRSISMVSNTFVFEVFVVKSAQVVTLSIIVLMCVTINDRAASSVERLV